MSDHKPVTDEERQAWAARFAYDRAHGAKSGDVAPIGLENAERLVEDSAEAARLRAKVEALKPEVFEDMERRLRAWEPVVREAVRYLTDEVENSSDLDRAVDALPPEHRPAREGER